MTVGAKVWIVLAAAVLPPISAGWGSDRGPRCATDGVKPGPLLRIRSESAGGTHEFCSVACAEAWRVRFPDPAARWIVGDEASGSDVEADAAWFVRSRVETHRATGERIHAFAHRAAAASHADAHAGRILAGDARPLRRTGSP